jgi:hypothetical protein
MNVLAPLPNPFGHAIITDAWDPAGIDIPEINARAFDTCLEAFERVSSGRGSESIVLHGQAGSGKTHLLGRLQHRLVTHAAKHAPDGALRCIFIAVKLQTSPHMLWQHLRRRVADDLLRVTEGASQLQRLVAHYLAANNPGHNLRYWVMQIRVLSQIEDESIEAMLDEVAEHARLGFELRRVLSHLIYRRNLAEARGWLRGDPLPEEALVRLGLASGPAGEPEQEARELITSLCRLAGDSLPMVFCFDQVEALQTRTDDASAFFRLGQQLATLYESDDNILLLTCLQSAVLDSFRKSVRDADWDRVARKETTLNTLDQKMATTLLQRRLESVPELAALRREHAAEPLWPLPEKRVAELFTDLFKVTARRALMHAEQLFEELRSQRGAPEPKKPERFLEDELERRLLLAERSSPSETDENLRHGLPLLAEALQLGWRSSENSRSGVQMTFTKPGKKTLEIAICNQRQMNSLVAALKRLVDAPIDGRRVILRDPRLPIGRAAETTRNTIKKLAEKGVPLIEPDREVLALLEAIRGVLSDARSGDLAHEGLPLAVGTVETWLRDALDPRLSEFLNTLFTGDGEERAEEQKLDRVQDLAALLERRCVLSLAEAAAELGHPAVELETLARAHPTRFGLLEGPPLVLFDWLPPAASTGEEVSP